MKQVPKSREYDVRKRLNFARFLGTSLNKRYGWGGGGGGGEGWLCLSEDC